MGKMKASVFTVAESVTNWFQASCRTTTTTKPTKKEADQLGTGVEVANPSTHAQTITVQVEASQPVPIQSRLTAAPQCGLTASPQIGDPADVAVPPRTDMVELSGIPTTGELDPEREATLRAFWSLLEEIGYET